MPRLLNQAEFARHRLDVSGISKVSSFTAVRVRGFTVDAVSYYSSSSIFTDAMQRPDSSEYPPFYHGYVSCVPDGPILPQLQQQTDRALEFWSRLDNAESNHSYAPGKWSLKEMLGHIIDTERVFSYRLLCFARGEKQPLPGMEQDEYMAEADHASRPVKDLVDEYRAVRQATLYLIAGLQPADWGRTGTASGGRFTLRAKVYILAGHELHHMNVLKERYGVDV